MQQKYQLDLLAKCAFGEGSVCVDSDVEFDLTNAYTVVLTCRIPAILKKTGRRTPLIFIGLFALTERRETAVYEEVALWLHNQMTKRRENQFRRQAIQP